MGSRYELSLTRTLGRRFTDVISSGRVPVYCATERVDRSGLLTAIASIVRPSHTRKYATLIGRCVTGPDWFFILSTIFHSDSTSRFVLVLRSLSLTLLNLTLQSILYRGRTSAGVLVISGSSKWLSRSGGQLCPFELKGGAHDLSSLVFPVLRVTTPVSLRVSLAPSIESHIPLLESSVEASQ